MKLNWLICAASVLILGCAEVLQAPALHDFGVSNAPPGQSLQNPASPEINVFAPKWLSDDRIHYRLLYDQPTRVRFYNLDQWIAPPQELLKLQLASGGLNPNYSLVIHLLNFEQQFEAPGSASVLLRFSTDVFAAGSKNKLGAQEFVLRSGKVSPDAQGAIKGFAELAEQANQRIHAWLQYLEKS
ncbi:hypothetical protein [Methylomicrobium sp. Wu6]|uniref:ABC-type transport auxiliary lipoprotein family protein n=1 Tax=Methylomicrobium sp. Wu6 TaxID=3107928 RepID=UPI002DD64F11|nr:hypothetical protein [Methylomicrobium sp. Wu6]MEC4749371.1 hypothetical protein [Methylomicrobium sp. Wu6]